MTATICPPPPFFFVPVIQTLQWPTNAALKLEVMLSPCTVEAGRGETLPRGFGPRPGEGLHCSLLHFISFSVEGTLHPSA